jgi:hypothetical protein
MESSYRPTYMTQNPDMYMVEPQYNEQNVAVYCDFSYCRGTKVLWL